MNEPTPERLLNAPALEVARLISEEKFLSVDDLSCALQNALRRIDKLEQYCVNEFNRLREARLRDEPTQPPAPSGLVARIRWEETAKTNPPEGVGLVLCVTTKRTDYSTSGIFVNGEFRLGVNLRIPIKSVPYWAHLPEPPDVVRISRPPSAPPFPLDLSWQDPDRKQPPKGHVVLAVMTPGERSFPAFKNADGWYDAIGKMKISTPAAWSFLPGEAV